MKSRTSTNTLIVSEDFTCEALPPESHSLNKQTIIQIISRMQKRAKDITFRIMALVRFTATLPVPFFFDGTEDYHSNFLNEIENKSFASRKECCECEALSIWHNTP